MEDIREEGFLGASVHCSKRLWVRMKGTCRVAHMGWNSKVKGVHGREERG